MVVKQKDASVLGRWGEAQAAAYLRRRGYRLLASGWRCRYGEIDIVARDRRFLVFVEVKLRRSADFACAREAVNAGKQAKLRRAALVYLAQNPTQLQPRFDVAEVYAPQGVQTVRPEIRYWENAFS